MGHPVPEVAAPTLPTPPADTPLRDVEVPGLAIEEPPALEATSPAPAAPSVPPPAGLEVDDPRTQAPPPDDLIVPKTIKVKRHRERQLKAESYHRDLLLQDILETALGEYFTKRYGRQGRGSNIETR